MGNLELSLSWVIQSRWSPGERGCLKKVTWLGNVSISFCRVSVLNWGREHGPVFASEVLDLRSPASAGDIPISWVPSISVQLVFAGIQSR